MKTLFSHSFYNGVYVLTYVPYGYTDDESTLIAITCQQYQTYIPKTVLINHNWSDNYVISICVLCVIELCVYITDHLQFPVAICHTGTQIAIDDFKTDSTETLLQPIYKTNRINQHLLIEGAMGNQLWLGLICVLPLQLRRCIWYRDCAIKRPDPWWRHQMETFSALLALCEGNSPVTGEFPSHRPATRSLDVLFDLRLNKRLSKPSRRRWF